MTRPEGTLCRTASRTTPHISLYLICSQLSNELKAISVPSLELKMCDHSCIHDYFREYPSMESRVGSIEVRFGDDFFHATNAERQMKSYLRKSARCWGFSVFILEMKCSEIEGGGAAVDGRAILRH